MQERRLFENLSVPEVGLGCWQLGADWGDIDESQAFKILERAYRKGVRLFDTAAVYGEGRSERLIGQFKEKYPDLTVITKSRSWIDPKDKDGAKKLCKDVENSLKNLRVDALDLLQLHCLPPDVLNLDEVWETLRCLKREGKIERFGASVETIDEGHFCIKKKSVESLQIIFNCMRQDAAHGLLHYAKHKKVGIIVRLPLASGLLAGKMKKSTIFSENDHRNYNKDGDAFNVGETLSGLTLNDGTELVDELKHLISREEPLAQLAMRWILDHEEISVVIPGASRVSQVSSNVKSADLPPLSKEVHEQLFKWYIKSVRPKVRGLI
ncbi:MAG: aldo/keto reductase [Lentisphaeria bacterium]|nr:aldo/keto reductase [Lentisphaeria bacterium]